MTVEEMPLEVEVDPALVRRLLQSQLPQWAELPLVRVESAGTDNAIYRLGDDMSVRLPRVFWAIEQVEKEQRWLPQLAPALPIAIPAPIAMGVPGDGYPWHWSVYGWLQGDNALAAPVADLGEAATALGRFVAALQRVDASDGPPPGLHNFFRGMPLATRDDDTRTAIASLDGLLDGAAMTAAWDAALGTAAWDGAPVWIHGDLHAANLLVDDGRISAVIDFGGLGVGDPACDVMVAWTFLTAEVRQRFRAELAVDDATWARGRGWALSVGVVALAYYLETNPVLAGIMRTAIEEVLADHEHAS